MKGFINVTKKDPHVGFRTIDVLDRYKRKHYKYQAKIGYDTLIQKVILKELIKKMCTTITDLDIELKMKLSGIEHLESKKNHY